MWCSDLPLLLVKYMFRDVVLNLYVKQIFRNEITEKSVSMKMLVSYISYINEYEKSNVIMILHH